MEGVKAVIAALAKALPELEGAKKNKANPHFKSKYADLVSVIEAIDPVAKHGLWYRQHSHEREDGACIETFYVHESGEEMSAGTTFMPASKKDAQGFGSALSYCKRYSLQTAFGLATEDDDGNAATASAPPKQEQEGMPEAEFSKLKSLAQASGTTSQELCKKYAVGNLRLLNQAQYTDAISFMNDRLAAKAKEESAKGLAAELGDGIDV